jgi:HAMP domain-containing protein
VVETSPLGSALLSRPILLSGRFRGLPVAIMAPVKVGTRLTLVLLLALTPTVALYTYWSTTRSTRTYIDDLKRETRATSRALVPALENDLRSREWDQIDNVLQRMSVEGTLGALFSPEGKPMYAATGFPPGLAPSADKFGLSGSRGFVEYEAAVNGRRWFCRLSPLKQPDQMIIGHLLVAQDWSDIRVDLRARTLGSVAAAIVVVTLIAAIIPLAIRRYISNPLRELSRRVTRLSSGVELSRGIGGDEVKLLSEEFRRLDQQLTKAGTDLMERHRRELELERRLQHADRLATIGTLASGLAHENRHPNGSDTCARRVSAAQRAWRPEASRGSRDHHQADRPDLANCTNASRLRPQPGVDTSGLRLAHDRAARAEPGGNRGRTPQHSVDR